MADQQGIYCIGSGVPGDPWEFGHAVIPSTEPFMFRGKNSSPTGYEPRCIRCGSHRWNYRRFHEFRNKASATIRFHARRLTREGVASSYKVARAMLERQGITIDFVAGLFADAINEPCPGLCGFPDRHVITDPADMHLDHRDPAHPMTPENVGVLCSSCNPQKQADPWAKFMARQRAIRANLEQCAGFAAPWLFDPREFGGYA